MEIKAKFENGHFVPLENIDKIKKEYENKEIKIEITPNIKELVGVLKDLKTDSKKNFFWRGALKHIKTTSIELQHKIKDLW